MKMMKKVLLVVLCLMLVASVSVAQTSGPSNVAGYVKISCGGFVSNQAAATSFGLPFKFWDVASGVPQYGVESTKPSDIVGDQANPGIGTTADQILRQGGDYAFRDQGAGNAWTGGLEDNSGMIPFEAYWYSNKSGAFRNLVLAGEVDNAGNYGAKVIPAPLTATGAATVTYSFRDSRNVPVELLGLLEAGFTGGTNTSSDALVEQGGNQLSYLDPPGEWDFGGPGTPMQYIVPGRAYWLVNKHMGHPWSYNYIGPTSLPARMANHEGVITSTKSSKSNSTSKSTVRATSSVKKSTSSKSGAKVRTNK
jgi:hypothetical protein